MKKNCTRSFGMVKPASYLFPFGKVRLSGDTLFYDPATNTFAVKAASEVPRTMFKATDGISYFYGNRFYMYPCPCCKYLTLTEPPPGTFEICPVCFWEDDNVQFNDPSYSGGANHVSLDDARRNFATWGAKTKESRPYVRPPLPEEMLAGEGSDPQ